MPVSQADLSLFFMEHALYLLRRLDALRELLTGMASSIAESLAFVADGHEGHKARLDAYYARIEVLRTDVDLTAQSPFASICSQADLSAVEEDILLLVLGPLLDRRFARLFSSIQGGFGTQRPTVGSVLHVLSADLPSRLALQRHLHASAPLLQRGLVRLQANTAFSDKLATELIIPSFARAMLLGQDSSIEDPNSVATLIQPARDFTSVLLSEDLLNSLQSTLSTHTLVQRPAYEPTATFILITGQAGAGKTVCAHACAGFLKRSLLVVDACALSSLLSRSLGAFQDLLAWARWTSAILFFDNCDLLFNGRLQGNRDLPAIVEILEHHDDILLMATPSESDLDPSLRRRVACHTHLDVPPTLLRERLWRQHLEARDMELEDTIDLGFVGEKYDFTGGQIAGVVRSCQARALHAAAQSESPSRIVLTNELLEEAAQAQMKHHLSQLAVETYTNLRLRDLVLPDDLMKTIRSIIAAVRNRRKIFEEWGLGERMTTGRGLNMLFRGESGTGKTLTSEIIAGELGLPLYRVAIPKIVSKYIGETEQNLEKAFREAEVAAAILLFDEADAIFTKRVEVSSSTDRYSNMEVNLLLQEMERFEGVVILTTNLDAGIDDAFDRRLNYKLDFPFPTAPLRSEIWQRLLPRGAPIDLDTDEIDWLADRFALTGGSIKNVVIRAAYQAAEETKSIDVEHLEAACIQEYKELGKLVRSVD